jgi:hypothetical protein
MNQQTRRDWLITISTAAAAPVIAKRLQGDTGHVIALPPGVYDPSTDHLSHALMSVARYHSIPPGCPTEYVHPRPGPFVPQFFSKGEFAVVQRLVQVILGETSDNSESVEETAEWIDLRVSEAGTVRRAAGQLDSLRRALAVAYYGVAREDRLATDDPAKICRGGLEWLSGHSRDFLSLGPAEQTAIMKAMSEEKADTRGGQFFVFLKTETIKGFYTTRTGLKELDYKGNAFYARSPGCST